MLLQPACTFLFLMGHSRDSREMRKDQMRGRRWKDEQENKRISTYCLEITSKHEQQDVSFSGKLVRKRRRRKTNTTCSLSYVGLSFQFLYMCVDVGVDVY